MHPVAIPGAAERGRLILNEAPKRLLDSVRESRQRLRRLERVVGRVDIEGDAPGVRRPARVRAPAPGWELGLAFVVMSDMRLAIRLILFVVLNSAIVALMALSYYLALDAAVVVASR